jgi:importin-7
LPNLFPQIMQYLQNTNSRESVYTGLQGLFALAARFEFELDEDRLPLHAVIKDSFEILGSLVSQMMQHKDDADALHMLHLICKVFYVSNQLQMCPYLMEAGHLDPWVQFFKAILDMECPPDLSAQTDDAIEINRREKHIFWKLKGITAKLSYRIFVKYGNPTIVEEKP